MMRLLLTLFSIFLTISIFGQPPKYDWKKMTPEQRKQVINKMSPEERKHLLHNFKSNVVIENLAIEDKDKEEFSKIYQEYLDEQTTIKKRFNSNFKPEELSDQEARIKLQESFDTGEKLLESRKKYSEKMQKVVPPQKVLKLFQNEGMMRDRVSDKKQRNQPSQIRARSNNSSRRAP